MTIYGENTCEINPILSRFNGMELKIDFTVDPFKYIDDEEFENGFYMTSLSKINFSMEEDSSVSSHKINSLVRNRDKLLKKIVQITNQVIKSFRVYMVGLKIYMRLLFLKINKIISLNH
jgi:hypothetical protein